MHIRSQAWIFLCAAGIAACASDKSAPAPHAHLNAAHEVTVSIWVQDHPRLPADLVLDGCKMWREKAVRCELVDAPIFADLQVVVDDSPCAVEDDSPTVLARTTRGGRITAFVSCFYDQRSPFDGTPLPFDAAMFRVALGHEVGHGIGVWDHIPEECHDGETVCGEALMNPSPSRWLTGIRPPDGIALDRGLDPGSLRMRSLPPAIAEADDDEVVETLTIGPQ